MIKMEVGVLENAEKEDLGVGRAAVVAGEKEDQGVVDAVVVAGERDVNFYS